MAVAVGRSPLSRRDRRRCICAFMIASAVPEWCVMPWPLETTAAHAVERSPAAPEVAGGCARGRGGDESEDNRETDGDRSMHEDPFIAGGRHLAFQASIPPATGRCKRCSINFGAWATCLANAAAEGRSEPPSTYSIAIAAGTVFTASGISSRDSRRGVPVKARRMEAILEPGGGGPAAVVLTGAAGSGSRRCGARPCGGRGRRRPARRVVGPAGPCSPELRYIALTAFSTSAPWSLPAAA